MPSLNIVTTRIDRTHLEKLSKLTEREGARSNTRMLHKLIDDALTPPVPEPAPGEVIELKPRGLPPPE